MSVPALSEEAATSRDITVAPAPASTAERTASFDGSSSAISNPGGIASQAAHHLFEDPARTRFLFTQHPGAIAQVNRIGNCRIAMGPRVAGGDHQHQFILGNRAHFETICVDLVFHETQNTKLIERHDSPRTFKPSLGYAQHADHHEADDRKRDDRQHHRQCHTGAGLGDHSYIDAQTECSHRKYRQHVCRAADRR